VRTGCGDHSLRFDDFFLSRHPGFILGRTCPVTALRAAREAARVRTTIARSALKPIGIRLISAVVVLSWTSFPEAALTQLPRLKTTPFFVADSCHPVALEPLNLCRCRWKCSALAYALFRGSPEVVRRSSLHRIPNISSNRGGFNMPNNRTKTLALLTLAGVLALAGCAKKAAKVTPPPPPAPAPIAPTATLAANPSVFSRDKHPH